MLMDATDSQLVLVDYQVKLMPHILEGQRVLANALRLARIAQQLRVPVWGTQQNPASLGQVMGELQPLMAKIISKDDFSAVDSGLLELLQPPPLAPPAGRPQGGNARSLPKHLQKPKPPEPAPPAASSIVIAGVEAHICLLQTALDLLEHEFDVWVVTDACSSRTERNRDAAFDRLAGAGADLVTTEMVAFEWLRGSQHPAFKDVLALIK